MSNIPRYDLSGLIDMHMHTSPDIRPRYCNDVQAAQEAKAAGMRAILLKSHVTITADRAQIAENVVTGIRVFGGLALNKPVGGLNPSAVEVALKMGAKIIWMPTLDAANTLPPSEKAGGISIFTESGQVRKEVHEIVDLIHQSNVILATGHISVEEILAIVRMGRERGLCKLLITHPDSPLIRMPVETQIEISAEGIFFERCYLDTTYVMEYFTTLKEIAGVIRKVGVSSTVLTTDFGLAGLPSQVQGLSAYLEGLFQEGIKPEEIYRMAGETPTFLLGL
jgi:hypothetical protein